MKKSRALTAEEILADTAGERRLIRFCNDVEAGRVPDRETLDELARCFRRILAGEEQARALDMARKRGRPQKTEREADEEFQELAHVLFDVMNRRDEGKTKEVAIAEASEHWDIPEDTIRDWYKRHRTRMLLVRWINRYRGGENT